MRAPLPQTPDDAMSRSYMFMKPARLPLDAGQLDADSALPLRAEEIVPALDASVHELEWTSPTEARGQADAGWVEFRVHDEPGVGTGTWLAMRCSLRADYTAFVQELCERHGWIAVDEQPRLFQPGREPQPL